MFGRIYLQDSCIIVKLTGIALNEETESYTEVNCKIDYKEKYLTKKDAHDILSTTQIMFAPDEDIKANYFIMIDSTRYKILDIKKPRDWSQNQHIMVYL